MKLQEALRLYLLVDRAKSTLQTYRNILEPFVAARGPGRSLVSVGPEDLDEYIYDLRHRATKYANHPRRPAEAEPLRDTTIHKIVKTLKTFFNWCVKRGYLDVSPARYLTNRRPSRSPGEGKAARDTEVSAILAAARFKPRDWAIILLLAQSGCRAGDVANLRISDLDLAQNRAYVRQGKGGKSRLIYFGPETTQAIRNWLERRPNTPHEVVFISTRGHGPMTPATISQMIRRRCREAGLERTLGTHALRHFVGMTLARHHVAPTVIQEYLGHENVATTMEYLRSVDERDIRQAGRLLSLRAPTKDDEDIVAFFRQSGSVS